MKEERKTKTNAILKHMRRYGSITDPVARNKYHTNRLSSIISNLRNRGYEIDTVMCEGKDEYGKYRYGKYIFIKEA